MGNRNVIDSAIIECVYLGCLRHSWIPLRSKCQAGYTVATKFMTACRSPPPFPSTRREGRQASVYEYAFLQLRKSEEHIIFGGHVQAGPSHDAIGTRTGAEVRAIILSTYPRITETVICI
jgi:hypothetical protein